MRSKRKNKITVNYARAIIGKSHLYFSAEKIELITKGNPIVESLFSKMINASKKFKVSTIY